MAHFHEQIHQDRINGFRQRLAAGILLERLPIPVRYAHSVEPVPFARRLELEYCDGQEGQVWGRTWESAWFQVSCTVPPSWAGAYVVLQAELGGEILVVEADGTPLCGLTSGSVFDTMYSKDLVHLLPTCQGGERLELWLEAASNGLFGIHRVDPDRNDDPARLHGHFESRINRLRLCRFDHDRWQLYLDVDVLFDLAKAMPADSVRRSRLFHGLSAAVDAYATGGVEACRERLKPLLAVPSDPGTMDLYGVGHAHIDTGWLWPVRETIRKSARTFASQIGLIERYPGYVFGASQPQHYAMVKEHYPALYEKIKQAVAAGAWELQGGMWVEADCNVPSGESLVRQILHGKNFFRDEFGVEVKNLWLPDVFGYSANLPQILARSGIDYFLTQKLSWSKYNRFPHKTFRWEGIDGSQVLAHFPPEDTYNSNVNGSELRRVEGMNFERAVVNEGVSLFGIGNGGGGPKEEHVEHALRLRDLNGVPRYHLAPTQPVLEKLAAYGDALPTWVGELYLEVHRGTLTTQARTKRLNRRAEEALRAAEMLAAAAGVAAYPLTTFDQLWKKFLINQFHDILPGSSIHVVYENTERELQEVIDACQLLGRQAAERLLGPDPQALTLFNPSSSELREVVALPTGWEGATLAGQPLATQIEGDQCLAAIAVPAASFVELRRGTAAFTAKVAPGMVLENDLIRYEFDANLQLTAAFDKQANRQILAPGEAGNLLSLYEDRPHSWDAWDVDEYYQNTRLETAKAKKIERLAGPVRQGLRATLTIGQSTIRQSVWLASQGKRLDFQTEVDWQERHKMLRVAFPTAMRSETAAFEVQYGHLRRTTHRNTYWDHACFEAVGHRWADISAPDYGVALLNDSKYGHKVLGGTLDLNLLRSSTDPDPLADQGGQQFTYSLLPHLGNLPTGEIRAAAAGLNQGLVRLDGLAAGSAALPLTVQGDGLELAVLKRGEKDNCLVARVVETRGARTRGQLNCANPAARIVPTNLVEWEDHPEAGGAGTLALDLAPFEIATFKLFV